MSFYTEPEIDELEKKHADARSAVRWMALALIFLIIAVISQFVWFIMLITNHPKTMAAFVVFIGSWILQAYCKWCSDSVKPESFK